jgi:endonuclease III
MTIKEKFKRTIEYFLINQPFVETELAYWNSFDLLVAVILSAQCQYHNSCFIKKISRLRINGKS